MVIADRQDPYAGYNFSVELDNITRAGFQSCAGLANTQSSGQYREGTDSHLGYRRLSGLNTYSDITLTRGVTGDDKLWKWRELALKGTVVRHDISITLRDDTGVPRITWDLFEAWPNSWTAPTLSAPDDLVAIEQITIAYERMAVNTWS